MRFAIVGVGDISHLYLGQAAIDPRIEWVGAAARRLERARAAAERYGIPAAFDDYRAMYDAVHPDVVIVATPSGLHVDPVMAALERGIHVVCEKPMAIRYDDCEAMVRTAAGAGLHLRLQSDPGVVEQIQRTYLTVERLGRFTGAEAQIRWPGSIPHPWYYDREIAGSGAIIDTAIYSVSALIGLLGPVRRVAGFASTLIPDRYVAAPSAQPADPGARRVRSDVVDDAAFVLEWETGQHAIVRALWATSFTSFEHAVFGRTGALFADSTQTVIHSPGRPVEGAEPVEFRGIPECYRVPLPTGDAVRIAALDQFVDVVEGTREPTWSGEQQLHVHDVLFRAAEAARSGIAQDIRTTFDPRIPLDPVLADTRSAPL